MKENYLIKNETAKEIYDSVKNLPILDYHCHLSAKDIYEDKVFSNIGEMWLGGDHYKWRLMRQAGVDEEYITGNADWRDKFRKYAEVIALSGGNPLYSWSKMELSMYFGIDTPLNGNTADEIFDAAQKYIEENQLSPRKLIQKANVQYIATTDDPADSLEWHQKLKQDKSFSTVVVPAFRPDNLLNIQSPDFADYIKRFGDRNGVLINSMKNLRMVIRMSIDDFYDMGSSFSDVGIEHFPTRVYSREEASDVFFKALNHEPISEQEKDVYIGYLFNFLAGEYKKKNFTMQLHLSAARNVNSVLFNECGRDVGGDCMGNSVDGAALLRYLDTINRKDKLPHTIIYSLNPQMNAQLATICGSFRNVVPGAAWWFCDHKRGIEDVMRSMAETSYFGSFMGMLTDSRSFLSYARHDYFRRILSSLIAEWVDEEDFEMENALQLAYKICYGNVADLVEERVKNHNIRRIIKLYQENY
ncbi:MAG: glucuronate isomerase [Clostridia bacterium]|nr:glucuronate isomerase [Clostridia bacterium]